MTTHERIDVLRARYRDEAARCGVNPRDLDVLIGDLLGQPLTYLLAHGETRIDPAPLDAALRRRLAGEPLQYIRRKTEFFGREFYVDDRVLIPRPETELVVETAIERIERNARVVDIGTGSGCIAISLALERPDLDVIGTDMSAGALAVASRNARGVVALVASDILSAFVRDFDWIVSNPPYIAAADVATLAAEVRDHEPRVALTPGPAGTEITARILDHAGRARVIMEMGLGQESAVRDIAAAHHFEVQEVRSDLAGIPRVIVLSRHGWN
jgi:release factor glutamine methyltransferase